jgi:hypothetical protein
MSDIGTGYVSCACRDCMEIAIGTPGKALCSECNEHGCEAGAEQECSVPYAYDCCEECGADEYPHNDGCSLA